VSDTPNHPGESDPTWRLDPTSAPPDPTASPAQDSDATRRIDPAPPQPPTFSLPPQPPQSPQPPAFPPQPPQPPVQPQQPGQDAWAQQSYPQSAPPNYPGLEYGQQQSAPPYAPPPGYQQQMAGYQPAPGYAYPPPQFDQYGRPLSDKSKVVAGVLGIALGGFGAGRFYTGHTGIAVAQLLVTIFTCGIGHFWGMIDGIVILANGGTDAEGRILRD
jgi:TM2 domain-containing membrane protein YozV